MTTLPTTDEVLGWIGLAVHDSDGTHLGSCQNVYADDDSQLPEWVEVALVADGVAFVPTLAASRSGDVLRLAHDAERIAGSPRFPTGEGLSPSDERALYDHYGVEYSRERSDSLLPAEADASGDGGTTPPRATRLRRLESSTGPRVTAPPPAAYTPYEPPSSGSGRGKAALLVAVPALLLLARRGSVLQKLHLRREPSPVRRQGPRAAVVAAPLLAGVGAALVQRRRTRTPVTPAVMPTPHVVQPPVVVDRETHTPV